MSSELLLSKNKFDTIIIINLQYCIQCQMGIDESLNVSLRTICNCDCEHPGHPLYQAKSVTCSRSGTLKCGVCECDDHHYGRQCECVAPEFGRLTSLASQTDLSCKPDNTTSVVCSGRGSCICGVCECEARENAEEVSTEILRRISISHLLSPKFPMCQ